MILCVINTQVNGSCGRWVYRAISVTDVFSKPSSHNWRSMTGEFVSWWLPAFIDESFSWQVTSGFLVGERSKFSWIKEDSQDRREALRSWFRVIIYLLTLCQLFYVVTNEPFDRVKTSFQFRVPDFFIKGPKEYNTVCLLFYKQTRWHHFILTSVPWDQQGSRLCQTSVWTLVHVM